MARRKKEPSLVEVVLESNWKFSATLAAFIAALVFIGIPFITNPILKAVSQALKSAGYGLIGIFGLVALVKLFAERMSRHRYIPDNLDPAVSHWQPPQYAPVPGTRSVSPNASSSLSRQFKPTEWSLELIREIEWKRFEELATAYYSKKGIKAVATPLGADGGIDIKLYQDDSGQATSIVQCKAWGSRSVGVKHIREFLGVMHHEKIAKGFYMTSGAYTDEAKEVAKANGITLITGEMLLMLIQRLPEESQQRLLALAVEGDYKVPTCPSCGIKMVHRTGKKGGFWGCSNYPKCRQMLHLRKNWRIASESD